MDREKFLAELFPLIGGKENTSLCEFRDDALYITLKDAGLADERAVAKLPDAVSVSLHRGRLTVRFGNSEQKEEVPFMANNEKMINEILRAIGGKENIVSATHCITRLRFHLVDAKKADIETVKKIDGVVGCVYKAGQFQVIIGPHVNEVYNDLIQVTGLKNEPAVDAEPEEAEEKKNLFSRLVDTMAGIVMPMIGPLAGAGMIKAILSLLTQFALISKESQTYQLFYLVADGVFYYMPFFLAFSAGKKFKCNPYLSLIFAAMLVHPNYIALKTAGEAVKLFGFLPVTMASYTSSVVPIILIVYF